MLVIIRRMKLWSIFKLKNLINDVPEIYDGHFVRKTSRTLASKLYTTLSLLFSLLFPKLGNYVIFLAFVEGKAEGIAYLRLKKKQGIFGIFVNKSYRGKGIGKKLMKTIFTWAKRNKIMVELIVYKNNIGAIKLYKKFGFKIKTVKYIMFRPLKQTSKFNL